MTSALCVLAMLFALTSASAHAQDRPGDFDYYVLALSWSPNWCLREGDARGAEQCGPARNLGWSLHGLWPQNERGWPADCRTDARDPSRRQTAEMIDIMGSSGLAAHQWRKHGRCSGLSAADYLTLSREAYTSVVRPDVLRRLDQPVRLPANVIEEAFLQANPDLKPDMLTVKCKSGQISEVRICLTKSLVPRYCGPDTVRDCAMDDALFSPIR